VAMSVAMHVRPMLDILFIARACCVRDWAARRVEKSQTVGTYAQAKRSPMLTKPGSAFYPLVRQHASRAPVASCSVTENPSAGSVKTGKQLPPLETRATGASCKVEGIDQPSLQIRAAGGKHPPSDLTPWATSCWFSEPQASSIRRTDKVDGSSRTFITRGFP